VNPAPSASELLISGDEPVEELRQLIAKFAYRCPLGQNHERCPFRMFGLLSFSVRETLINEMHRDACLHFFDLERECRASNECKQTGSNDEPLIG
jgi:hypothetical protein